MYWDVKASRKARQPYPSKANFVQKKKEEKKRTGQRSCDHPLIYNKSN